MSSKPLLLVLVSILLLGGGLWLVLSGNINSGMESQTSNSNIKELSLPTPQTESSVSIEEGLAGRRSIREYGGDPLSLIELGQLLWAAQGLTEPPTKRAAPSAGATYPLELYAAVQEVAELEPGLYRYEPQRHGLVLVRSGKIAGDLQTATLGQSFVEEAAVNLIFTAVFERTTQRYSERGRRYVYMEVGHSAQNVYLQSESLKLGTVAVGAFDDEKLKELLQLSADQEPVYIMPVGSRND